MTPNLPSLPFWIPLLFGAGLAWLWRLTLLRLRDLDVLPLAEPSLPLPSVCLCIPARNEVREVGAALDAWLASDHPGLRIVVVDDGSTDGTSEVLALRAAAHAGRLTVRRVDALPAGWLGKNHALHLAASLPEAREAEWLLFADADVQASPDLIRRCFQHLRHDPFDLLALLPVLDTVSFGERVFLPVLYLIILWGIPPRRVAELRSRFFCGSGAFNLVRRLAYDAIGGHAAAPLEPIDDMMLARRLKRAGFMNHVATAGTSLHIRAAHGLWQIVNGLRKNALGLRGLWPFAPILAAVLCLVTLCPLWMALMGWPIAGLLLWLLFPPMV